MSLIFWPTAAMNRQFENALIQWAIAELAVGVIVLILLFWATYWVIKAGVRDGIREADSERRTPRQPVAPPGYRWTLVEDTKPDLDMRAD